MKLLLTSAGFGHKAIGAALVDLVGKPASETKVGFIPTAANVEPRKKDWLINELLQLWRQGYSWIDVIDFSAPGVDWKARLAEVDVVYLAGGDPYHLLDQMHKTGFDAWLTDALKTKIYVGGSASAMAVTPTIELAEPLFAYQRSPNHQHPHGRLCYYGRSKARCRSAVHYLHRQRILD
jgi:dipeptidase E